MRGCNACFYRNLDAICFLNHIWKWMFIQGGKYSSNQMAHDFPPREATSHMQELMQFSNCLQQSLLYKRKNKPMKSQPAVPHC